MRRARHLAAVVACLLAPATATATATAAQSASIDATLTPERLGAGSTVGLSVQITAPAGRVPPPLTGLDVRLPANLGIAASGLGVDSCSLETLESVGPDGCPLDSRMGYGSALTEIPFGPRIIHESTDITIVRAPTEAGHLGLLIHASGVNPVIAQINFPALLFPSPAPYGEQLRIAVPPIPSLPDDPDAPDVALVSMRVTLGPEGIVYDERVGNRLLTYRPGGILLPESCPRGGFPFAATFDFLDGSHATARTSVSCPPRRRRR